VNLPLFEPEVTANLERAEESIRAAQVLYEAGHWDFAAARAYYATFYAATDYLKAGYPVLLVRTHEPERFIGSAVQQANGRTPYQWDVVRGYREMGNGADWQECDPFDLPNVAARGTEKAVWFLRNFHFWLNEPQVIQAIQNNLPLYKTKGDHPGHRLPGRPTPPGAGAGGGGPGLSSAHREELKSILAGLVESTGIEPEDEAAVLDAAPGAHLGGGRKRPGPGPWCGRRKVRPPHHLHPQGPDGGEIGGPAILAVRLSDNGLEEAICDRLSFQRFLGLSLTDPVPDDTRICRFRNLLAEARLGERLFAMLEEQLQAKGLLVRRGYLIDATLIKAQPHPRRRGEPSGDPDADWTRRGKDGHFGYKVHLSVDHGSGLLRRLDMTAASVSESHRFEDMVRGDEAAVFADGAYAKDARKTALRGRGVFCGIINRPWRYRPISEKQKRRNKFFARVRGPWSGSSAP
jgi:IS5 family transposase